MRDHMAICNRWVGGRRRSKQEVIITLPAAALHLLTTWTNWKKFRNIPNINRCFCTHTFLKKKNSFCLIQVFVFRKLFLSWQSQKKKIISVWFDEPLNNTVCYSLEQKDRGCVCECVWVYVLVYTSCDWVRGHFCLRQTLTVWTPGSKVQMEKQMAFFGVAL